MTAAALSRNVPKFATPFDDSGTNSVVPSPSQMSNGWIPNVESVDAEQQNYLHKAATTGIYLAQLMGLSLPFNPDGLGGSLVATPKGGIVSLVNDGTGATEFYVALADMPVGYTDPSLNPANWTFINFEAIARYRVPYADAAGTADVRTGSYTEVIYPVLQDGMRLTLHVEVPNATTTPTFQPTLNGSLQTARAIVKMVGGVIRPLAAGDLNDICELSYNLPTLEWILINPASGDVAPGTIIDFSGAAAPAGYIACPTVATNISRTAYASLFAAIGTAWGVGDGATTFGMPFFPADYAAIHGPGSVGTNSAGQVIAHSHSYVNADGGAGLANGTRYPGETGIQLTAKTTGSTGGAANLSAGSRVLKCVKY